MVVPPHQESLPQQPVHRRCFGVIPSASIQDLQPKVARACRTSSRDRGNDQSAVSPLVRLWTVGNCTGRRLKTALARGETPAGPYPAGRLGGDEAQRWTEGFGVQPPASIGIGLPRRRTMPPHACLQALVANRCSHRANVCPDDQNLRKNQHEASRKSSFNLLVLSYSLLPPRLSLCLILTARVSFPNHVIDIQLADRVRVHQSCHPSPMPNFIK